MRKKDEGMKPLARSNNIVVEEVFDELVIYDLERDRVHSLNPTAAFVWQHCDGKHTVDQIAILLQQEFPVSQAVELLWATLDRLEKAHLLQEKLSQSGENQKVYTRRELLKMVGQGAGMIALLPVVKSINAPGPTQAASLTGEGCTGCGGPARHKRYEICCCETGNGRRRKIKCRRVSTCHFLGGRCV